MIVGTDVSNSPLGHLTILIPDLNVLAVDTPGAGLDKLTGRKDEVVCCMEVHHLGVIHVIMVELLRQQADMTTG